MPTTLNDHYILGRTLGSGVSCKVKLAKDNAGERYAIKIMNSDEAFQELVQTECEALQALAHRNIVRLIEVGQGVQANPKKGSKHVKYIVLELVSGGELFDFVALGGRLSEPQARYFFGELLAGLGFMHERGYAHRDLKPENIMLDRDFTLKIADFGFAAPVRGRDGSGLLETPLGTASYMAPEIHLQKPYDGKVVDLFASAIILFVILTQRPPFASANPTDPHYRLIATGNAQVFWQAHSEAEGGSDIYSAEFKDLFGKMMVLNPADRLTLDQVLAHPWMQGPVASEADIHADFTQRKATVENEAHQEREKKREARREAKDRATMRSGAEGLDFDVPRESWEGLEVDEYGVYRLSNTEFFTEGAALDFFEQMYIHLKKQGVSPDVSGHKLRLKYSTQIQLEEAAEESKEAELKDVQVVVQVYEISASKRCVSFIYRDPATKVELTQNEMISHFLNVRNSEEIKPFCDTTYDEGQ